jgi:hypothetical protein
MPHKNLQSHKKRKVFGPVQQSTPKEQPKEQPLREDQIFRREGSGRPSGVTIDGKTFLGLKQSEIESLLGQRGKTIQGVEARRRQQQLADEGEIRRAEFQEETGSGDLISSLKEQAEVVDVFERPETLASDKAQDLIFGDVGTGESGKDFINRLIAGGGTQADIDEALRAIKRGTALGIGIGTAISAAPWVAANLSRSAAFKLVLGKGGSVPLLTQAIGLLSFAAFGGAGAVAIFDAQGGEMRTLRKGIQKITEDGERIEASSKNSGETTDTILLLEIMADEVTFAEQRLKELGENNVQYQFSKEYITDAQNVRSARIALKRRAEAVENLAATGQAVLNPQAVLYDLSQNY